MPTLAVILCVCWSDSGQPAREKFNSDPVSLFWLLKAYGLHDSATVLWSTFEAKRVEAGLPLHRPRYSDFPNVSFMLAGMALECIFKAYLIARAVPRGPVPQSVVKDIAKGAHDLGALLRRTKMQGNATDRRMLDLLSHSVRWDGRYPMPHSIEEMERYWTETKMTLSDAWAAYLRLYEKYQLRADKATLATMKPMIKPLRTGSSQATGRSAARAPASPH